MEEEWREGAEWLARVGLIGQDHVLNSSTSKMIDLAKFLRDGVMLCKLLYLIDENSIDLSTINQRPQNAQFLCMKNIKKFLHTCSHYFDIRESDLFEPQMLFEFTDFGKVLHTLSKLSRCSKIESLKIDGFPKNTTHRHYDHEIYKTLQDMANRGDIKEDKNDWDRMASSYEEDPYSFIEEDIYEELVPPCQERSPDKRELCLRELIETEKNYSDALKRVLCNFYKLLKDTMGEENCSIIFFKFKEMEDIHTHLYKGLYDARANPHNMSVSQVFITSQEKLLIYGDYCANLSKAQILLENLMAEDPVIRQKIKDCEMLMSNRQYQLRDYLVVPLQRILKYHLLLGELLKHTQENHDEYYGLKKAFEAMVDVADYVNEVKRDKETLQIIQDLQSSITDIPEELKDLREMGRLKLDGEIKIECHPDKNKTRFVFIFDKIMIMCKHPKVMEKLLGEERYLYKDSVFLENCKVDNSASAVSSGGTKRANSFFVVTNGCKKAYTIITKNEDTKNKWMKAIYEAIENVNPPENALKNHRFLLTSFERPNVRCDVCGKLLKGCFFQGYECNTCRTIAHKACLKNTKVCRDTSSPSTPSSSLTISTQWPDYWNLQVREYPWWVERMSREEAASHLFPTEEGTFLLRWSDKHNQPIVSIKAMNEVKHMRVHRQQQKGYFYFSDTRSFPSIVELINFYRQFKLSECFQGLERTLKRPLYDTAIVLFPYQASGPNQLRLRQGQRVIVVSREGENMGWWKGRIGDKTGYFPKEYVRVETDSSFTW